jgi:hypothetical protein
MSTDRTLSEANDPVIVPQARRYGVEMVAMDDEVVIYDTAHTRAHALNRTSAAVWQACDGRSTVAEALQQVQQTLGAEISEETLWLAVDQFQQAALLEGAATHAPRFTRRQAVRAGIIGSVALLPAVTSIVIPTSRAAAASQPPP